MVTDTDLKTFRWRFLGDTDLDWEEIRAKTPWEAAEAAANEWDKADRHMVESESTHIFEIKDSDDKITRWSVWGMVQYYYCAHPS